MNDELEVETTIEESPGAVATAPVIDYGELGKSIAANMRQPAEDVEPEEEPSWSDQIEGDLKKVRESSEATAAQLRAMRQVPTVASDICSRAKNNDPAFQAEVNRIVSDLADRNPAAFDGPLDDKFKDDIETFALGRIAKATRAQAPAAEPEANEVAELLTGADSAKVKAIKDHLTATGQLVTPEVIKRRLELWKD